MKTLLIAVIIFAVQPAKAPPHERATKANRTESIQNAKGAQQDQTQPAQPSPAASQASIVPEGQRSATTANNHAQQSTTQTSEEDRSTQRKLTWFTGMLAAVGVLQLVVMFLTWIVYRRQAREMRRQRHVMFRQWNAMREQGTWMEQQTGILVESNIATRKAAEAAAKSAEISKLSVDLMISKERARIRIEMGDVKLGDPGDEYAIDEVTFQLFCHGTTPAFIVERMGRVTVSDSPAPVKATRHPIGGSLPNVVYPSPYAIMTSTVHIHQHLDDSSRDAIREGKLIVQFFGQIKYRDVFDNMRETRFRYRWNVIKVNETNTISYWTKHIDEDNHET